MGETTSDATALALSAASGVDRGIEPALTVPISPGELLDKISILEIKSERIAEQLDGAAKLANVRHELAVLCKVRGMLSPSQALADLAFELKSVNEALWDVEDALRDCERRLKFGPHFVELARSVYRHNDRRAAIKRQINELLGSRLVEEKAYVAY
jgi:hypothetical protein